MLMMIYMTRIQNMSFFLLKVNNPSVRHPIWPRRAPRLAPRRAPCPAPIKSKKIKIKYFLVVVAGWKRGEKIFRFSIPKIPQIPELRGLRGLRGRSREKKKVFSA
jgi:hypothetical protein